MTSSIESHDSLFVELHDSEPSPQQLLAHQALVRKAQGDLAGALDLYRQVELASRQAGDAVLLSDALGNQAAILQAQGDLDAALRLLQEKEVVCRNGNNSARLAGALVQLAQLLALGFSRPAEALPLAEEALRIASRPGYVTLARRIEPIVNEIRGLLQ